MSSDDDPAPRFRTIDAVATSIDLVEELRASEGASIRELARTLDISVSTAHAHLSTLIEKNLIVEDEDGYRPSLHFLEIGSVIRETRIDLYRAGRSPAKRLAEETGEVVWLMVEENGLGYYVGKEIGEKAVESGEYVVGTGWPLHCSASGKVVLAEKSTAEVNAILDRHGMEPITKNTITDRERLFEELERIRERGFGFNHEEDELGLQSVAAPVKIDDETLLGAVSVCGPVSRMRGQRLEEEIPELLLETANVIEINARGLPD